MGSIDFGQTPNQNLAVLKRVAQEMADDLYDNGTPGLITRVEAHMSEAIGANAEQARQHKANSFKLNVIMALAAIMALVISVVGIFVTIQISRHGVGTLLHTSQVEVAQQHIATE